MTVITQAKSRKVLNENVRMKKIIKYRVDIIYGIKMKHFNKT